MPVADSFVRVKLNHGPDGFEKRVHPVILGGVRLADFQRVERTLIVFGKFPMAIRGGSVLLVSRFRPMTNRSAWGAVG